MSPLERKKLTIGLLFCSPVAGGLVGLPDLPAAGRALLFAVRLLGAAAAGLAWPRQLPRAFPRQAVLEEPVEYQLLRGRLGGLSVLVALTLALLLNSKVKGLAFYRTVFFLPSLMPLVAGSILWLFMYKSEGGLINALLKQIGINGPAWLADSELVQACHHLHGGPGAQVRHGGSFWRACKTCPRLCTKRRSSTEPTGCSA